VVAVVPDAVEATVAAVAVAAVAVAAVALAEGAAWAV
jgi:hypothetical protein